MTIREQLDEEYDNECELEFVQVDFKPELDSAKYQDVIADLFCKAGR